MVYFLAFAILLYSVEKHAIRIFKVEIFDNNANGLVSKPIKKAKKICFLDQKLNLLISGRPLHNYREDFLGKQYHSRFWKSKFVECNISKMPHCSFLI